MMTSFLEKEYAQARKEKGRALSQHELRAYRYSIPKSYSERIYHELDAALYVGDNARGKPCALGFRGQARKPEFHYMFPNVDRLNEYVDRWASGLAADKERREDRVAKRKALADMPIKMQVGQILHYSWGYDQTNNDFYQVVEVKAKSIVMREIASKFVKSPDGFSRMSGHVSPVRDAFLENAPNLVKIVRRDDNREYVVMDFGIADPCADDSVHYESWYA